MDQERIGVLLALLAGDPRVTAEDDRNIMECEWLGGRLPEPPPFADPWCDGGCPDDCDPCERAAVLRAWERAWASAWDAVLERIIAGDDSWEDDFHYRAGAAAGRRPVDAR
jgi:hypothetical protein